ncbi:ATP-binding protein [Patescibacteria group bacterium]
MESISIYFTLIIAVANFIIGWIVLYRNPKKIEHISFAILAWTVALWVLINFLFQVDPGLLYLKSQYALGGVMIPISILWLTIQFVKRYKKVLLILFSIISVIVLIIPYIDGLVMQDLIINNGGFIFENGPLFDVYSVVLALLYFTSLSMVIVEYVISKKSAKKQLFYVLFGFILFGLFSIIYNFFLPILDIRLVSSLDAQSSVLFVGFLSYAMLRHGFLDIKYAILKSLGYFTIIAGLAVLYVLGVNIIGRQSLLNIEISSEQLIYGIIFTVLAVLLFQPLQSFIRRITDKFFYKGKYFATELLKNIGHTQTSVEFDNVANNLIYKIVSGMKLMHGFIIVKRDKMINVYSFGKEKVQISHVEYKELIKKRIHADTLSSKDLRKSLMNKLDIIYSSPFKMSDGKAILGLGLKSSGERLYNRDIDFISALLPEISLALSNAEAFDEISQFGEKMAEEVKKKTSELKKANARLKQLDKTKSEFLSIASHQLRTPASGIKGYLSMLSEGDFGRVTKRQGVVVNNLLANIERLIGVINTFLNVSRIEQGRFEIVKDETDVVEMVKSVMMDLQTRADQKSLDLKFTPPKSFPLIPLDEEKLRHVVINFIDNAIKYTPDGSIEIILEERKTEIQVTVKDTGIGLSQADISKLFEKFSRAQGIEQVHTEGSGLGLFVAKRVVEGHGGKIWAESKGRGKGSKFCFTIPKDKNAGGGNLIEDQEEEKDSQ